MKTLRIIGITGILCARVAFGTNTALVPVDREVASVVMEICPSNGMTEAQVKDRWGEPTSVNSPGRHFLNPPDGFSYWMYRSRYRGEKLDGPPTPEDSFLLVAYFIHGKVIGSELETRQGISPYSVHVAFSTSGVFAAFAPAVTRASNTNSASDSENTLLAILRDYRDAWRAGHNPAIPSAGHIVMNHPPAALTSNVIGAAFCFSGPITRVDAKGTDKRLDRHTQPRWAATFADDSKTFARTHVAAYERGSLLTPVFESEYTNALQQLSSSPSLSNWFRRFELAEGVRGYIRTGFGGCMLVATVPSREMDILVSIDLPSGDAGPFYRDTPQTHEYYSNMHNNPVQTLHTAFPVILDALK